jgi:hypothetical protein
MSKIMSKLFVVINGHPMRVKIKGFGITGIGIDDAMRHAKVEFDGVEFEVPEASVFVRAEHEDFEQAMLERDDDSSSSSIG